ncbi:MAG TPA: hypothetical protein VNK03_07545 [Gammaproteobacteria bacterium]|nr:hypothetical protein [Gammaproteobacteria bacterium]
MLKSQDIVILLKILARCFSKDNRGEIWSQSKLAVNLCMSVSEVNAGLKRLHLSALLGKKMDADSIRPKLVPIKENCEECLISAVKYFIPVQVETYTRGIATSYAAPIFGKHILIGNDPVPVWPYAEGKERGLALEPLYKSVPESIIHYPDQLFYELLVLVDAVRSGRTRERNIAIKLLKEKINYEQ